MPRDRDDVGVLAPDDLISRTERVRELSGRCLQRNPALLVIGSADRDGGTTGPRIVHIQRALEIGRRPPAPSDPPDPRWVVPDRLVSSRHARIQAENGAYEVIDLDSTNGTFVAGRRVADRAVLTDGALMFFGGHAAVFRMVSDEEWKAIAEEVDQPFAPVPTLSPALAMITRKLRRLAKSSCEVLLTGETGVGKEVFANAIHRASGRSGPFVPVNCATLPKDLAESELFGYVRGAHSMARESKPGLVQAAAGGTLFLDELGEMPGDVQAKLLRFLQDRRVIPLGSTTAVELDVRVIAAALHVSASGGTGLRPELAARLGAEAHRLPPLRDRVEDVGALLAHFLGTTDRPLNRAAFYSLCLHSWPKNVRELEKVAREAEVLSREAGRIGFEHLPRAFETILRPAEQGETPRTQGMTPSTRSRPSTGELQILLRRHGGNVQAVARELRRQSRVVWRWLRRAGLEPKDYKQ